MVIGPSSSPAGFATNHGTGTLNFRAQRFQAVVQ